MTAQSAWPAECAVFVGSRPEAGGLIYCLALDLVTGHLRERAPAIPAEKPSFIALHPSGAWLYAVREVGRSRQEDGRIGAYDISASGTLTALGEVSSHGAAPCFLAVSPDGRHLFAANYWGGTAAVFHLCADGRIGAATVVIRHEGGSALPGRDPGPHPHWFAPCRNGTCCLLADLGLDRVFSYRFEPASGAVETAPEAVLALPGDFGPRHCAQDVTGRTYVIGEFASAVATFPSPGGPLRPELIPTLPADGPGGNAAAHIALSPDERFLYASNRGDDSIAWFAREPSSGRLSACGTVPSGGHAPRHFAIDPSGRFLVVANQLSDRLTVFALDPSTGRPDPTGCEFAVSAPTCVQFAPAALS